MRMGFCLSPWAIGCEDLMQGDLVAYGSLGNKVLGGFAHQIQSLWMLHTSIKDGLCSVLSINR